MSDDDPAHTITFTGLSILSATEAQSRAAEIRENALDEEHLTDSRTADIDALIAALETAKERGVETVKVNDDGRTRPTHPKVTNNHAKHHAMQPEPDELHEWVEL
jgi:hypothetical protein